MSRLLLPLFIIVFAASPISPALGASITLNPDPGGMDCFLAYDEPGLVNIYAFLVFSPGATSVQFSAPIPDCWTGVTYLSDIVPSPFISIGNSQTGIAIAFGSCIASPIHVLTMQVFTAGSDLIGDCCDYYIQPDPTANPPGIYYTDCDDPPNLLLAPGGGMYVTRSGGPEPPVLSNPSPADGALDQPLDSHLEWDVRLCSCGLGVVLYDIYFGTDPDPPLFYQYHNNPFFDPGILLPETTYYWKIHAIDTDSGPTTGPVWSFTTESAIPVEKSSWGRIKSLYK
jgi:hypothetical protein